VSFADDVFWCRTNQGISSLFAYGISPTEFVVIGQARPALLSGQWVYVERFSAGGADRTLPVALLYKAVVKGLSTAFAGNEAPDHGAVRCRDTVSRRENRTRAGGHNREDASEEDKGAGWAKA
jgi:hypothetical protein